jgi:hypothetical protein
VPDSLALTLLAKIAIAWVVVSVLVAVVFGAVAARLQDRRRFTERRRSERDRRSGLTDRRIGMPDARSRPIERRAGPPDRRSGPPDRRQIARRSPSLA